MFPELDFDGRGNARQRLVCVIQENIQRPRVYGRDDGGMNSADSTENSLHLLINPADICFVLHEM